MKTYKVPVDVTYAVDPFAENSVNVYDIDNPTTIAQFFGLKDAQGLALSGSGAAKAAVMFYEEKKAPRYKVGTLIEAEPPIYALWNPEGVVFLSGYDRSKIQMVADVLNAQLDKS